ncbi:MULTISPECIES: SDR family oxidoreductase [Curtobacterium]|uniref:SDR family NAD(P)-dependent oxidoreductase n=1 Tax=Curtobacterium TaxID=2034 RepID=UPI00119F9345|nr:SDR family oxidoreductase [Curtobacterium pusillum]
MARNRDPYRGRLAVVTGASGGIGESLAEGLAAGGADLVLVARSADRLETVAGRLRSRHGVSVRVLPADLATGPGVDSVIEALQGTRVDVLVANAGVGWHGSFAEQPDDGIVQQIALNETAVVRLVRAFLPGMTARRVGGVMTVASTASFQPTPHMALYGATKAFVLSFTEALWEETRGSGVRVLALCPGPTSTGFFEAAGGGSFLEGGRQTADEVARVGLEAFARNGGPTVVSGARNAVMASAHRFVPRGLMARMSAMVMR